MADARENCIEWLNGSKTISCTLNQKRLIAKVEKMAVKHPDLVQILERNSDGSIFAHLPLKALKLSIIIPRENALVDEEDVDGDDTDEADYSQDG